MKSIILANIGNRNLTYQGKNYDSKIHGSSFREWTLNLLNQYDEQIAADLSENILVRLFNPDPGNLGVQTDQIERMILFATNQVNEQKQDQDTLYEAELIRLIFEAKYRFPVEIQELQCRVTDNDALLHRYRNKLRSIFAKYPTANFIVCDAGGTAQLKFGLKIMIEYLLPSTRFEVLYVPIDGPVERVPQKEYRQIIDDEQARSLILAGQHRAALTLRGISQLNDVLTGSDLTNKLILFAYARFNRLYDLIKKISAVLGKKISQYPDLLAINQQVPAIGKGCFMAVMTEKQRFIVGELLLKTRYLFNQERYNEAILTVAVMYETYLASVISHSFGYNLIDSYNTEKERLKADWSKLIPGVSLAKDLDVPGQIDLCLQVADEHNQHFLHLLNPRISRGLGTSTSELALNTVRNRVAHNGLYVTDEYVKKNLAYLPVLLAGLYDLFELPVEDPFEVLNQQLANAVNLVPPSVTKYISYSAPTNSSKLSRCTTCVWAGA